MSAQVKGVTRGSARRAAGRRLPIPSSGGSAAMLQSILQSSLGQGPPHAAPLQVHDIASSMIQDQGTGNSSSSSGAAASSAQADVAEPMQAVLEGVSAESASPADQDEDDAKISAESFDKQSASNGGSDPFLWLRKDDQIGKLGRALQRRLRRMGRRTPAGEGPGVAVSAVLHAGASTAAELLGVSELAGGGSASNSATSTSSGSGAGEGAGHAFDAALTRQAVAGLCLSAASLAHELEGERAARAALERALDRIEYDQPGVSVAAASIAPPREWNNTGKVPRQLEIERIEAARKAIVASDSGSAGEEPQVATGAGQSGAQDPQALARDDEADPTEMRELRQSVQEHEAESLRLKEEIEELRRQVTTGEERVIELQEDAALQKQLADGRLQESRDLRDRLRGLEEELRKLRVVEVPETAVRSHPLFKADALKLAESQSQLKSVRASHAALSQQLEDWNRASGSLLQQVQDGLASHDSKLQEALQSLQAQVSGLQRERAVAQSRVAELEAQLQTASQSIALAEKRSNACKQVQDRAIDVAGRLQTMMQRLREPQEVLRKQLAEALEKQPEGGTDATAAGAPAESPAMQAVRGELGAAQANVEALTEMIESTQQDYINVETQCSALRKQLTEEQGRRAALQKIAAVASQEAKQAKDALEAQEMENGQVRGALQQADAAVQAAARTASEAQQLARAEAAGRAALASELDGAREAIKSLQRIAQSAGSHSAKPDSKSHGSAPQAELREKLVAACKAEKHARDARDAADASTSKLREQAKRDAAASRKEIRRLQKANERLAAAAAASRGKSAGSGSAGAASGGASDEARARLLAKYKRVLRCPVRTDRFKDAVLSTCWHCFSEEALQDLIKQRKRSCPSCGKRFGAGDVHKIFMTEADVS